MTAASEPLPVCLNYRPRGRANHLIHRCTVPEVLISGPAGTGKSLACLYKLHLFATRYPGARCLILRQTRESLTSSGLVTFERDVLYPDHPAQGGAQRLSRQAYTYPNGSEVAVRGLRQGGADHAARVMSSEYDLIYVQEATEIEEGSWENLTTRLRSGRVPFQQMLADANPDRPTHWLKRRCDAGRTLLLESRHEDNPRLWDEGDWTEFGRTYLARLDALTGPRRDRLRFGRWVQAEGVVYEGWDAALHVVDRFPIPNHWPRLLSVDFGYTNPFVCQWWALDDDGRLFRYREIYLTRRLVEDHARRILELSRGEPVPVAVVCDHDAEDRATLERHLGWETAPAVKEKSPGIQVVQARLRKQGDGRPRLFLFRDSLDERDTLLDEAKRPCCTEEEWDGYVWDVRGGRRKGEEPVKENDHGLDALRYMAYGLDSATMDGADEADTVLRG